MVTPDSPASEANSVATLLRSPSAGLGRPRRVRRFLALAAGLMIGLGALWAGYALTVGHAGLLVGDVALVALGATALALARARAVSVAVHLLLVGFPLWVCAMAWFVSGSGVNNNGAVHFWLVVYIAGLNFLFFDAARVARTFYSTLAILVFVLVEYNLVPLDPPYGFPAHATLFGHGLTLGLVLIALAMMMRLYINDLADAERRARDANQRSEQLLHSLMPASVVARVRSEGTTFVQRSEACTVLFADLVGFTPLAARIPGDRLVALLNAVFTRFDALCETHGVEKIKTIGDGYMAASGLPVACEDHAERAARLALDMLTTVRDFEGLSVRIGMHSGPVLAGIIGQRRIAFDLWGETVNLASRMESHGEPDRILVTDATAGLLAQTCRFGPALTIDVKGRGPTGARVLLGFA